MTHCILGPNGLDNAKALMKSYYFNVEEYVKQHLYSLYELKEKPRLRVSVSNVSISKSHYFFPTALSFICQSNCI